MTLWQHLYWKHGYAQGFRWDEDTALGVHHHSHHGVYLSNQLDHLYEDLSFEGDSKPMATSDKKLYKVPEALGGGTFEVAAPMQGVRVSLDVPGVGTITVPLDRLKEVKPPLPPEPGDRSVVRAGNSRVYERNDAQATTDRNFARRWYSPGLVAGATWEHVCSLGTPFLLVPNPLDDAPDELPYVHVDRDGDQVTVDTWNGDSVKLTFGKQATTDEVYEVYVDRTFALAVLKATTPST